MGEILVGCPYLSSHSSFVQPILACAIVAVIANVSMIVSSFFTFSPFLTGLGPVDDVAYPPVVRAQLADFLALALALAFDQYRARPVVPRLRFST